MGAVLLPSDWACLMTMISLGFAMVARPVLVVRGGERCSLKVSVDVELTFLPQGRCLAGRV